MATSSWVNPEDQTLRGPGLIVGLLITIIVGFMFSNGLDIIAFANSQSWQTTTATITEPTWVEGDSHSWQKEQYIFTVDGINYSGYRVRFGWDGRVYDEQLAIGEQYAVYYDPADPRKSTLHQQLSLPSTAIAIFFAVLFVLQATGVLKMKPDI